MAPRIIHDMQVCFGLRFVRDLIADWKMGGTCVEAQNLWPCARGGMGRVFTRGDCI